MNYQPLIPSLKLACSTVLARHAAEDINPNAYLALGLDGNDTAYAFFVNNPNAPIVPANINSAIIVFTKGLIPMAVALAGMDLAHEVAVERMANVLLSKIPVWIFDASPKDARFFELGDQLSTFATNGIITAITAQAKPPAKPVRLANCNHPERN